MRKLKPVGRRLACAALVFGLFVAVALAQTNYATLGGTVADASGALIPGVTITARHVDTGVFTGHQ